MARSGATRSKSVWTEREKRKLEREARALGEKLGRPLRPLDFKKIKLDGRSFFAIKSQAARLGLYENTRRIRAWTEREKQILVILGEKRHLGARSIKKRGFFSKVDGEKKDPSAFSERSVDSIAQKKRREGLVDPMRSIRAKLAKRLTREEKRRLKKELRENPRHRTTEEIARDYGVAPSTIRSYRKRWNIPYSWADAMALPASKKRQRELGAATRERNLARWRERKESLRDRLRRERDRKKRARGKKITWRVCERCGEKWPATQRFFAPSPKRRNGRIVKTYLRRTCRVCPRRQGD